MMQQHRPTIGFVIADTHFHSLAARALQRSIQEFEPDDLLIFSNRTQGWPSGARIVNIDPIASREEYNRITLEELPLRIVCDYYVVLQYDGFVLNGRLWDPAFLKHDYIGAPWPNYPFHRVGNGGFSLRSKRLVHYTHLYAGIRPKEEAEDVFIGRTVRPLLEARHGIVFGEDDLALRFSFESPGHPKLAFGFHGVLNLPIAYRGSIEEFVEIAPMSLLVGRRKELEFGANFLEKNERLWFLRKLASISTGDL